MKIVFVGNCQAGALRALYDKYVQPYTKAETSHVRRWIRQTEVDQQTVAQADRLAVQEQAFATQQLPSDRPEHRFPVVIGTFLWPFAGMERVGNEVTADCQQGPFPADMSDSHLDRAIQAGTDVETAARAYIDLDVTTVTDLDRLYDITIAKQRRLDETLGFQVARIIADHFRDEALFTTVTHPGPRIMKHLAVTLFRDMGVDEAILRRIETWERGTMLPSAECPIHPSVARHFGLRYVDHGTLYRFHHEGRFSFADAVRRYLTGAWNPRLAEALGLVRRGGDPAAIRPLLEQALKQSPESAPGWIALAGSRQRLGDNDGAIRAARNAVLHDPDIASHHSFLAGLLLRSGDQDGARQAHMMAHRFDPGAHFNRLRVPFALMQLGDVTTALRLMREQAADPIEPFDPPRYVLLTRLLDRAGETDEAMRVAHEADALYPGNEAIGKLLTLLARRLSVRAKQTRT